MTNEKSVFVVRESFGTYGFIGPPPYKRWEKLAKDEEETRFTLLSRDGQYFAVGKASVVNIFKTEDGTLSSTVRHRMLSAQLSPSNRYLTAWDNPGKGAENFNIWSLEGEQRTDKTAKKIPKVVHSQQLSKLPEAHFSWDDTIYARLANDGRILFYETTNFHKEVSSTPPDLKISNFSFSPGVGQLAYVCYVKGGKQQATSSIKLYKYPNVDQLITQRSSFQSERISIKWNQRGTAALVTTMTDIDKTGGSYYGKTSLEYLDVKGESFRVQVTAGADAEGRASLTGDLHACQWSPNSTEFCVIVGKMPNTRAAMINSKGEMIMDMEIAARNEIYFNPQGNLVLLCGLGNLPGNIEVWELKTHKKCIARFQAQNATQVEWLNDGAHFITATTAPRMQVDNGFIVWNFMGKSVFEWKAAKHLFGFTSFIVHEEQRSFPTSKLDEYVKSIQKVNLKSENTPIYVPIHKRRGVVGAPIPAKSQTPQKTSSAAGPSSSSTGGGDVSANEKEIRNLKKRIEQIQKLKKDQEDGKTLEKNQLEKIQTESGLLKKLEELSTS